jgi:hypothetical protein
MTQIESMKGVATVLVFIYAIVGAALVFISALETECDGSYPAFVQGLHRSYGHSYRRSLGRSRHSGKC